MSCSMVNLLPFLLDELLICVGCAGSGVGVVGRAKLKAVNVDGKVFRVAGRAEGES